MPVISSFTAIAINITLDILLYKQYKHIGLTIATSFSAMVNYLILLISLNKQHIRLNNLKYFIFLIITSFNSLAAFYISNIIKVSSAGKFQVLISIVIFSIIYLVLCFIIFNILNLYKSRE